MATRIQRLKQQITQVEETVRRTTASLQGSNPCNVQEATLRSLSSNLANTLAAVGAVHEQAQPQEYAHAARLTRCALALVGCLGQRSKGSSSSSSSSNANPQIWEVTLVEGLLQHHVITELCIAVQRITPVHDPTHDVKDCPCCTLDAPAWTQLVPFPPGRLHEPTAAAVGTSTAPAPGSAADTSTVGDAGGASTSSNGASSAATAAGDTSAGAGANPQPHRVTVSHAVGALWRAQLALLSQLAAWVERAVTATASVGGATSIASKALATRLQRLQVQLSTQLLWGRHTQSPAIPDLSVMPAGGPPQVLLPVQALVSFAASTAAQLSDAILDAPSLEPFGIGRFCRALPVPDSWAEVLQATTTATALLDASLLTLFAQDEKELGPNFTRWCEAVNRVHCHAFKQACAWAEDVTAPVASSALLAGDSGASSSGDSALAHAWALITRCLRTGHWLQQTLIIDPGRCAAALFHDVLQILSVPGSGAAWAYVKQNAMGEPCSEDAGSMEADTVAADESGRDAQKAAGLLLAQVPAFEVALDILLFAASHSLQPLKPTDAGVYTARTKTMNSMVEHLCLPVIASSATASRKAAIIAHSPTSRRQTSGTLCSDMLRPCTFLTACFLTAVAAVRSTREHLEVQSGTGPSREVIAQLQGVAAQLLPLLKSLLANIQSVQAEGKHGLYALLKMRPADAAAAMGSGWMVLAAIAGSRGRVVLKMDRKLHELFSTLFEIQGFMDSAGSGTPPKDTPAREQLAVAQAVWRAGVRRFCVLPAIAQVSAYLRAEVSSLSPYSQEWLCAIQLPHATMSSSFQLHNVLNPATWPKSGYKLAYMHEPLLQACQQQVFVTRELLQLLGNGGIVFPQPQDVADVCRMMAAAHTSEAEEFQSAGELALLLACVAHFETLTNSILGHVTAAALLTADHYSTLGNLQSDHGLWLLPLLLPVRMAWWVGMARGGMSTSTAAPWLVKELRQRLTRLAARKQVSTSSRDAIPMVVAGLMATVPTPMPDVLGTLRIVTQSEVMGIYAGTVRARGHISAELPLLAIPSLPVWDELVVWSHDACTRLFNELFQRAAEDN